MQLLRKELQEYIDKEIKSKYKHFDKAHSISHFNFVTKNCVKYGKALIEKGYNVNLELAYVVGAYHDIGLLNGRADHAISSGKFVRSDTNLRKFFDDDTIELIAEAVEDHSSHLSYEPRSIYGKIVADADRNNSMYLVFSRPVKYGLKNEKEYSREEQINRAYEFVNKKFGRNGYVKYWLDIPDTTAEQNKVWELLDNENLAKYYIAGILDEVSKGKKK